MTFFIFFPLNLLANDLLIVDRRVNRIIIDPGLGGSEKGKKACLDNTYAKDINLNISKLLSKTIQEHLDIEVLLTRQDDKELSIENRLNIINNSKSDLLISIQTNSHENNLARGIETYFLNLFTEHNTSDEWVDKQPAYQQSSGDLRAIYKDLLIFSKMQESSTLAKHIQSSICEHLEKNFPEIVDRGTKQSPLEFLINSNISSIVVFTGFLSNPQDCEMLSSIKFQKELAEGIVKGIVEFMNDKSL